ncbi:CHAT domain-containing protein [Leptolyngbya sp. AN02str]|uniref:CHAT domain-containing protein n=1 Tax=Leptolyngbya sp. AN02str TaxID=3423363 RepID=UPI003D30FFCF
MKLLFLLKALTPFLFLFVGSAAVTVPERVVAQAMNMDAAALWAEGNHLYQRATQQYQVSQFQEALQSWEQALEIYRNPAVQAIFPQSRMGEGRTLNNLGNVYADLGQYQQAIDFYEQSLSIAHETGDRQLRAGVLGNLGSIYENLGQYQQVIHFYEQSLAMIREIGDRQSENAVLNNLGIAYANLGQYQQAINFYEQSLIVSREIGDRRGEGKALGNLGNVHTSLGQYQQAISFYQQSLAVAREIGDRLGEGNALGNLGTVYISLAQYQKAIDLFEQSLTISREIGNRTGIGKAFGNLGNAYFYLAQYQQAINFYEQDLAIAREIGDRAGEGTALGNLGNAYSGLNQYQQAIDFYEQSLAIAREIGDRAEEGIVLSNLGSAYFYVGHHQQAIHFYEQRLEITREIGERAGEGIALGNLGNAYAKLGQHQQAFKRYQQALAIAQEIGDREREGLWLSNIGLLLYNQEQPELAITFLKKSVNVRESIRDGVRELPKELQQSYADTVAQTYRNLADLLLSADRILEAQEVIDLLKLQELDEFQLQGVEGTPETRQGLSFWQAEREILERYDQFILQPDSNINDFIVQPDIGGRITQLRRDARGQNLNPEQLVRLQRNLQQAGNAALLYPLILDDRLELVLVTATGLTRHTVPVDRPTLEAAIANFRRAITDRRRSPQPQAQELYRWLITPLVADLEAADTTTILYAADGQLRYIPLAALHDGKQWLTQRYTINHITAASLLDFSRREQAEISILAGAFPAQGMEIELGQQRVWFNGLPFAHVEVQNLINLLPQTTAFFSENFNRNALEPELNTHRILHLATHAEFKSGHPIDSFILLGDGDRITLFDLDQWNLPNMDLVVLSACRTGVSSEELGTGEEILGFGYQVQRTGARGAIASLWYVNDGGTQVLMDAFYASLSNGYSPSEALRRAQVSLITNDETVLGGAQSTIVDIADLHTGQSQSDSSDLVHPYYWAPFILIGNGF